MKSSILILLSVISFSLLGQNKLESSIKEYFDGTSVIYSSGLNYEYDANNLITIEGYVWNNSAWEGEFIKTYAYNADKKVTESVRESWDGTSQFINQEQILNTYNNDGLIIQRLVKKWDGTQWIDSDKEDYYYDSDNKMSTVELNVIEGGLWINNINATIFYTGNNRTQIIQEFWDGSQWDTLLKNYSDYNLENKIISNYDEEYNGTAWVENERFNYDIDANFNRLSKTGLDFGIENSKTEYEYDMSSVMSDFAHPFKDKSGFDHFYSEFPYFNKILSETMFSYDNQTSTYEVRGKTTYNYDTHLPLNLDFNSEIQNISLYPNPANDYIQLKGITKPEKVTVYSVLGVKVFNTIINENEKLNIYELNNGLYFLKFENGNTLKFLKK